MSYNIYCNGSYYDWSTTTSYTDPAVQAGATYTYQTLALDAANNYSSFSNAVSATIPSSAITVNARVQTTAVVNVRKSYSTGARILGTHPAGMSGTVAQGPKSGSGYKWWYVNFDSGADGWVIANNLTAQLSDAGTNSTQVAAADSAALTQPLMPGIAGLGSCYATKSSQPGSGYYGRRGWYRLAERRKRFLRHYDQHRGAKIPTKVEHYRNRLAFDDGFRRSWA